MTVAKEPVTGESTLYAVKPLRRECRIASAALYARVRILDYHCTRDRGCSAHPAFPAPSDDGGEKITCKTRARCVVGSRRRVCLLPGNQISPSFRDAPPGAGP